MPEEQQEMLAGWLLEEIEDEAQWDALLEQSGDLLEQMAEEALAEDARREMKPLNPDRL